MVKPFLISILTFLILLSTHVFAKKQTEPPEINLSLSKETVWQREQVILTLRVTTDDLLARLDRQEFEQNGLTIIPFKLKENEQNNKLTLSYQWIIFPFVAGDHTLNLPRIRFRPNSGRPIKLVLPQPSLTVRTLPIYVPPTMPVGRVKLDSSWENGFIIPSKRLLVWNIKADSSQVSPQTLPAISSLLRSSESLDLLPPKRKLVVAKSGKGLEHQQQYQVPVKAKQMGFLDLPEISIQYFDPENGKLKTAIAKSPFVMVLNRWLLGLIGFLLLALTIFMLRKIILSLNILLTRNKLKKAAITSLKQSKNYQDIRHALKQYAFAQNVDENLDENVTLEQFASKTNKETRQLINQLQTLEFSKEPADHSQLKLLAQELANSLA